MIRPLSLIVTDASPLITLAAADALDCLTMANVPVVIPDMVYFEVTQDLAKLGAEETIDWMRRNRAMVEIVPTQVFAEFQALKQINPATRSRGRGEAAAQEVLNAALNEDPALQAILFYEDTNVGRSTFLRTIPVGVTALTTGDLLYELEAAGKIQSKDRVLDAATLKDRNVSAQRAVQSDLGSRAILRDALSRRGPSSTE